MSVNKIFGWPSNVLIILATLVSTAAILLQSGFYAAVVWLPFPIGALAFLKARFSPLTAIICQSMGQTSRAAPYPESSSDVDDKIQLRILGFLPRTALMHAIIFDIDGTLLDSFDVDGVLFERAIETVTGISGIDTNWGNYRHVTDRGILAEILESRAKRLDETTFVAVEDELVRLLKNHIAEHGPFPENHGAKQFVRKLLADDGHYIAYATGASRGSAITKLESAGLPLEGVVLATSSDAESRIDIMQHALGAAPPGISRITYFGDGQWDVEATRELGWEFVPIGNDLDGLRDYGEVGRWLNLRTR